MGGLPMLYSAAIGGQKRTDFLGVSKHLVFREELSILFGGTFPFLPVSCFFLFKTGDSFAIISSGVSGYSFRLKGLFPSFPPVVSTLLE